MNDTIDLFKIKIEKARGDLPEETSRAIDAVDWKSAILGMRESKGYSFEQLGDLETETELLLCGLLAPEDYPKELETRMGIPRAKADELVNDMNTLVFSKIREELIKNAARKKVFERHAKEAPAPATPIVSTPVDREVNKTYSMRDKQMNKNDTQVLHNAGIKIIDPKIKINAMELKPGKPEEKTTPAILTEKFAGAFQIPMVKTEHSLDNLSKTTAPPAEDIKPKLPTVDPYREVPE